MRGAIHWIDTDPELQAYAEGLGAACLGIDTEADSFHRYRERLCLLQIHDGDGVSIVDPLAVSDLSPLRAILEDPARRKVLHGGDYDVRLLRRDHGIAPKGLFDTMIAARLVGARAFGLAALLEQRLGVAVDKTHQRADWARRPLPERMLAYAAEDTRHLITLAGMLEEELGRLGRRAWAEEEFRRLESVQWAGLADDPDRWRRVKGAAALDPRSLAVLRAAWRWREERARRLDRPPFRALREDFLVDIARNGVAEIQVLASTPGAPRAWKEGGGGIRELHDAIQEARALPDDLLPEPVTSRRPLRDPAFDKRVAALRADRDRRAEELDIEPSVLASRSVLEAVQRSRDAGGPADVVDLRDWQRETLGLR